MRYGYFDDEAREYVIDRVDAPFSMTNYLGTQRMGAVLSHNAGGYCWLDSPQFHRVTRFRPNGVPMDFPGHYVYLRDAETGEYWSVSWQPTGLPLDAAKYACRHGLSYSTFTCEYRDIAASQTLFIPREAEGEDPVEIFDVRVKNLSDRPRTLEVTGYVEFSFHSVDIDNQNFQMSLYCAGSFLENGAAICELHYEPDSFQFLAGSFEPDGYEGRRDAFIGAYHTERNPVALERGALEGGCEQGGNPIGALMKRLTLAPGEEQRVLFYLGTGRGEAAERTRRRYDFAGTDRAFAELRRFWDEKLGALQVRTPHGNMNRSLNIWNLYQSEINVLFSRFASFIEVGGRTGLGFRDTAQDAMCIPHAEPEGCRWRLTQLLNGLTSRGYGLHLFDPAWFEGNAREEDWSPTVVPKAGDNKRVHGIDDACADDALWLVPAVLEYVRETGDAAFLEQTIPFADGGEDTVWAHMKRILDFSYGQLGSHGITKGLRADWNDCLNLGGGESAMVAFLLVWATEHFLDAAIFLKADADAAAYEPRLAALKDACQACLWDGKWFLRGFTADGRPIGSHAASEGKVHLESNAWAVASGAATREQGISAMDAVDEWLYTPYGLMLNAPAFTRRDDGIGFITRVYPGIKENGSVFSHPNPWAWVAECRLGRGSRAMKLYDALLPENQNDIMEIRQAEPYTYCQFIMGRDHASHGKARHPFMTGSAGWAYFAATRYMLGVRPEFDRLTVDPCIPAEWDGFAVTRRWRGAEYEITVENPNHVEKGVAALEVDGEASDRVPAFNSGIHRVRVVMG